MPVIEGQVEFLEPTQTYGEKGFKKRTLVLAVENGRYTDPIPVEITRDMCAQADTISVGDTVAVQYRLRGRKWQKSPTSDVKYFLSAEVEKLKITATKGGFQAGELRDDDGFGGEDTPF